MRIVIATRGFASFGGSETYVLTVAEQLQQLGHDVDVCADRGGAMSAFAAKRGIRVSIGEPRVGPPDVLLVQDGLMSYKLAELWPLVPQVFRACSDVYDFQLPPQLPNIVSAIVVASARMKRRVEALNVVSEITVLRQPIDIVRFAPRGEIRSRPRRAVLLGNYLSGYRRRLLEDIWGKEGVELVSIGVVGEPRPQPEDAIADADIVVGKARAILEGMACGRAAYVLDGFGGDGWVTPERYPAMEADNFIGQATDWMLTSERLAADIAEYRPEMGVTNRDIAVAHHSARDHAHQLVRIMRGLIPRSGPTERSHLAELARLNRVQSGTELELFAMRSAHVSRGEQLHRLESSLHESGKVIAVLRAELANAHAEHAGFVVRSDQKASQQALEIAELESDLEKAQEGLLRFKNSRRVRAGLMMGSLSDKILDLIRNITTAIQKRR